MSLRNWGGARWGRGEGGGPSVRHRRNLRSTPIVEDQRQAGTLPVSACAGDDLAGSMDSPLYCRNWMPKGKDLGRGRGDVGVDAGLRSLEKCMMDGEGSLAPGGCRMLLRCDFRITCPKEVENCGKRHGQVRIQERGGLHMSETSSVICCYICMTWPLFTSKAVRGC